LIDKQGMRLVAGELCLDFANTADWHARETPIESLLSYRDLVSWSHRAGLLNAAHARRLLREAARRPAAAAAALRRAIAVREIIYGILLALLHKQAPVESMVADFNRELMSALRLLRVAPGSRGLIWSWEFAPRDLAAMLAPILRSAADLLTSERLDRIGQCADDRGCGWLFLDTTKNRSRRWCDMRDCGNRAKVRRHYQRGRARGASCRKS
jgi:predicted RNA-binding Zn ribbon-like protein